MPEIIIRHGREKSILNHHPWIFSGSIDKVNGSVPPGGTVDVVSQVGEFLARAAYNPHSQISARVWTWNPGESISPEYFEHRLNQAISSRNMLENLFSTNAIRLVHGESDGIPGLIVDRYDEALVVQFLTAGVEFWRDTLKEILRSITKCEVLYERSDVDVRKLEGLIEKKGLLFGNHLNNPVQVYENDARYWVDIEAGHKTGFYLDQRDNRLLAKCISDGRKVLDCFSYTGGFAINTMLGNAKSITLVDSSGNALDLARENFTENKIAIDHVEFVEQDVFKYLRLLRDMGESFDMIILDPPKFAPTAAQAERASRAYKDINLLALKLLNRNGLLLTFSCSGGINEQLFQKIVTGAAADAQVDATILKRLHQSADHPVALNFPEGAYLKGFLIQKLN